MAPGLARALSVALLAALGLFAAAAVAVYVQSERLLRKVYDAPDTRLTVGSDPVAIARGGHIVHAVGVCATCPGSDLGGQIYADMGLLGVIAGPNLTRGRGGIGATFTDADWARALRYGVRKDGTTLIAMPSEVFTNLSDPDLAAIVAYVRQLPPVDREVPRTRFGPVGRVLLAAGRLSILAAPKTVHRGTTNAAATEGTPEHGRYLADVSGCHGCHGYGLSGGRVAGPSNLPPAANLTRGGLGSWRESDFVRAMRSGRRPDGSSLNEFMPWRSYAAMTDVELHALWLYLRSAPPKAFGNK